MYIPSITTILGACFVIYMAHSLWTMSQLFSVLKCSSQPCFTYLLNSAPKFQLALFTSTSHNPIASEVSQIYSTKSFDYSRTFKKDFEIDVPLKTRRNGTLYLQVVFALSGQPLDWRSLKRDGPTFILTTSLSDYVVPAAESFNLLREEVNNNDDRKKSKLNAKKKLEKPVTHLMSNVYVTLLTDSISLSHTDVPPEIAHLVRISHTNHILPILKTDFFNTRLKNLVKVTKNTTEFPITFHYSPIGTGKLRLMLMVEQAMKSMYDLGFSKKDVDEVKGIFSDTNLYLLCGTVFVATIHLLFDLLSFKNDVLFWKRKTHYGGLSTRATIWRAVSQSIIFLYLYDENTSGLVLVPAFAGVLIELWKCKKILNLEVGIFYIRKRRLTSVEEERMKKYESIQKDTEKFDKEGMRYLSFVLWPLCLCGAMYSLLYQPHRSWYSWTLQSLVNGVYSFGFLLMLPQLFINYRLKSVANLPWRAFMYKAFNTFIDDVFAFIITMPTAHRIACLRDDVVFVIYLYQRWLYPIDHKRLDTGTTMEETSETEQILNEDHSEKKNQ